jgi:hypothetical protein
MVNQLTKSYPAAVDMGVAMTLSARRLVSPVGFLLALVFFLLPFAAISIDTQSFGSLEVSYAGLDLITNGKPSITGTGQLADAPSPGDDAGEHVPAGTIILGVLTALVLLGGLIATLKPMPAAVARPRGPGGVIGLSVVAAGLLVITEMVFSAKLDSVVSDLSSASPFNVTLDANTGIGFWLSLLVLVLVFGFAVGSMLWDRMQKEST